MFCLGYTLMFFYISVCFLYSHLITQKFCFLVELLFFQCLSLLLWLEERYEAVYMRHPGFQKGSKPLLALDNPFPMELPENLFGEKWAFVQLPISGTAQQLLLSMIMIDGYYTYALNPDYFMKHSYLCCILNCIIIFSFLLLYISSYQILDTFEDPILV